MARDPNKKIVVVKHKKDFENTLMGELTTTVVSTAVSTVLKVVATNLTVVALKWGFEKFDSWKLDRDIERLRKRAEKIYYENMKIE